MKIYRYCVHPVMNRKTNEIEAEVYAEGFLGWLLPRVLSKKDWEYIGKRMDWMKGDESK